MTDAPDHDADVTRIMTALAHGIHGRHQAAMDLLMPIMQRGPQATCCMLAALADAATLNARRHQPPGTHFGLAALHLDGSPGDIDNAAPGPRFAARFVTAWANGDHPTAYALYEAMLTGEAKRTMSDDLAIGIRTVYDMAVTSLRDMRQRENSKPTSP
ncbi:hypothetical protein ABZ419_11255 [Streptomyces cinnamoneus]|uniref:hypothetical protein n=1 Tax=Streptomyces cinnamoneus TaxID=53446 RepID=UPI0033DACA11